jgi:hypothetical protein
MMSKAIGSAIDPAKAPNGMILHNVVVHRKGDDTWASPPSRQMLVRDGTQIRWADGKPQHSPSVSRFAAA